MAKTAAARKRGCRIPASLQREEVRALGRGLGAPTGETWPTRDHIARGRRDDMIAISRNVGRYNMARVRRQQPQVARGRDHLAPESDGLTASAGRRVPQFLKRQI